MTAAILKAGGEPLRIGEVAPPTLATGEVIVDVVATALLPSFAKVFSCGPKYTLVVPRSRGQAGRARRCDRAGRAASRSGTTGPIRANLYIASLMPDRISIQFTG